MDLRSISLRYRLIGLVALAMAVSLALGGALAALNATRSVQTEMRSALAVARQAVENALERGRAGVDLRHEIESVIAAFGGNRHVRLRLEASGFASALPAVEEPTIGAVPSWFVALVRAEPTRLRLPVALGAGGDAVVIETDPHNEIVETWDAFCDTLLVLALFAAMTFAAIHVLVGRALRPLARFGAALEEIGRGDYAARVEGRLAPELARLHHSFNAMADRLEAADARNRLLTEQLLTLQEAERREIARDLHDEIGPFLFAVNVDAAAVARLAEAGRAAEIPEAARGIADAVGHMQRQVRSMLHRLRPAGLAEFGLAEALQSLVEFWRQRRPEIDYRLAVASGGAGFGELVETTIYRLVQEGLSNAVRHGAPTEVAIAVRVTEGDRIAVEIADDGCGVDEASPGGFGLLGMEERVRGLGGSFVGEGRAGGGFIVRAVLPATQARVENPLIEAAA
jgi:two-component system sensor histidine kinase UhpB